MRTIYRSTRFTLSIYRFHWEASQHYEIDLTDTEWSDSDAAEVDIPDTGAE